MEIKNFTFFFLRIKSGCWDSNNVFIYATSNRLKYALFTGDYGIIKTLAEPLYLAQGRGKKVTAMDRELNVRTFVTLLFVSYLITHLKF